MMRTPTISDPDCTCATPWAGLTLAQQKEFIKSVGGRAAAADYILSGRAGGGSQHKERNRRIRETHSQGRGIDHDHEDLSTSAAPKEKVSQGGPARALDRDIWNAIVALYPLDGPDRDVLIVSAQLGQGESKKIGEKIGISARRVRGKQDERLVWVQAHLSPAEILAHMDDPITTEQVARRAPSRAGRKPKGAPKGIPRFLTLVAISTEPPAPPRQYRPRCPRRRFVDPRQCDFGWGIAA